MGRGEQHIWCFWFCVIALLCILIVNSLPLRAVGKAYAAVSPEDILERAESWIQAGVPYSMERTYQGYRTDCSGFVSFAWGLRPPGLTTATLDNVAAPLSKDELQPADILNNKGFGALGHTLMFVGWADSRHTTYNAYEMSIHTQYGSRAHYAAGVPYPYWGGDGGQYVPMRLQGLAPSAPSSRAPEPTPLAPVDRQGPALRALALRPNPVSINRLVFLSAMADDTATGGSRVRGVQYRTDGGPWAETSARDQKFDQTEEEVTATLGPFRTVGAKQVCLRGFDGGGNIGPEQCIRLEVFDASVGFVTGQGSIESPAGAYASDPGLAGAATFTFLSQYPKGSEQPAGHLDFHLEPADLRFKADVQRVLFVSGASAQFQGIGALNGRPGYNFLVAAGKGRVLGGDGRDRFRIKIWRASDGAVVYDNVRAASDELDAAPAQAIAAGAIVFNR